MRIFVLISNNKTNEWKTFRQSREKNPLAYTCMKMDGCLWWLSWGGPIAFPTTRHKNNRENGFFIFYLFHAPKHQLFLIPIREMEWEV